ncbi:hypothetical protein [Gimesia panareensis]|uniref:hypothetical protein n=1 Tax=Gimesia panareensis TaxID=2527978 RepID=UPI0011A14B63|nr:hypothetical protein [Gimesia panareensis]
MHCCDSSRLLRISLLSNAVFSAVSGMIFVAASTSISPLIDLPLPSILTVIGISLVIFAILLTCNATRKKVNLVEAWIAVTLDIVWVSGSGVVIFAGTLNSTGNWGVAILADIVLMFALLQYWGLCKIHKTTKVNSNCR